MKKIFFIAVSLSWIISCERKPEVSEPKADLAKEGPAASQPTGIPMVSGGPCSYADASGEAIISGINKQANEIDANLISYLVHFQFRSDDSRESQSVKSTYKDKISVLEASNQTSELPESCARLIVQGERFKVRVKIETQGTCTPTIWRFPCDEIIQSRGPGSDQPGDEPIDYE